MILTQRHRGTEFSFLRSHQVKFLICMTLAAVTLGAAPDSQKRSKDEPEFFSLTVDAKGATGSSAASMKLQLDRYVAEWRDGRLEIGGAELLAAGVPEGPAVGRGLAAALAAKLDGQVGGRDAELGVALEAAQRGE